MRVIRDEKGKPCKPIQESSETPIQRYHRKRGDIADRRYAANLVFDEEERVNIRELAAAEKLCEHVGDNGFFESYCILCGKGLG